MTAEQAEIGITGAIIVGGCSALLALLVGPLAWVLTGISVVGVVALLLVKRSGTSRAR